MDTRSQSSVELLGIRIHDLTRRELVEAIIAGAQGSPQMLVFNVNAHAFNLAARDARFKRLLQQADIVFCDGMGVRLGARLSGKRLNNRNTPPDWFPQLAAACVKADLSLYILGAAAGVAEQAAEKMREFAPGIRIVGVHHGYFDKTAGSAENDAVIEAINQAAPDILVIGFGMPIQEFWIEENRSRLNATVFLPVGGMVNYLAGHVYRAPKWITSSGFEWLARLVIEPRRLWRRYVIGNPAFLWRVMRQRFARPRENSRP